MTKKDSDKMKIEIWVDIICPFCYIGKRKFEAALEQFKEKDSIEITWKSFQLSPEFETQPDKSMDVFLSEHKGISIEEAKRLHAYVTNLARQVGLVYNFDKAVAANSFKAHRFSHFSKQHGKQNEAEEKLFFSYFTDGKNIDDDQTLVQLGKEIGVDAVKLEEVLRKGDYSDHVRMDIAEAQQLGVRGVPFFVFNRKYAVSGAQETSVFLQTLEKSFAEFR